MKLIKRKLFDELVKHLSAKEISIIVGPRQIGKTTLMKELMKHIEPAKKIVFFNLDFENDKKFFESQELLLKKIKLEIGESGFVFIDEIQRKNNAGLFLKGIYDLDLNYKFIVSGSGSLELKEQIKESLTGRKRIFELLPVTFEEFLNFKTDYKYENNLNEYLRLEMEQTNYYLSEYLSFGGYPRVITEVSIEEKTKIINEIYNSYVEKDIVNLLNIDRPDAFTLLIKLLASNIGKLTNYSILSQQIGISVATLKKYLRYAEKTFIIHTLSPFYRNIKKELTKSKTIYFYDMGLRNFANDIFQLIDNRNELSFLFQNFVKNILYEKVRWTPWKINFWRTTDKAEVDFVIVSGNKIIPVEVKYSSIKNNVIKRSLRSFIEKYSPSLAYVVNLDYSTKIKIKNTTVVFIPYYELLTINLF